MTGKNRTRLQTPGDTASELARVYRSLKSGEITTTEAKCRAYILRELRQLIEATVGFEKSRQREERGLDMSTVFDTPDWSDFLPAHDDEL